MKLADYLHETGQTAYRFAPTVGVAETTLRRIMAGQVVPQAATRRKIIAASGGRISERDLILEGAGAARSVPTSPAAPAAEAA